MLGDRIKYLRNIAGLTQEELCKHIDIAQSTLAMLESNKRKSAGKKTLLKLADFFEVSINYFLIEEFWNIDEREKIKKSAMEIIKGDNPIDAKITAAINIYKSYYYRSLEASNFNNKHAKLEDFIAMMLNQENSKNYLPSDIYNKLVEKYGLEEGIPNGQTYFNCNNIVKRDVSLISGLSKKEEKYINYLRDLNDEGQKKVIAYTKDLMDNPKYKKEDNNKVIELSKKEKQILKEEHLIPIAAHAKRNATLEDIQHDNDIMDNDDIWND